MAYISQSYPMEMATYRMTAWHRRVFRKLGNGNESLGARLAAEKASETLSADTLPKPTSRKP